MSYRGKGRTGRTMIQATPEELADAATEAHKYIRRRGHRGVKWTEVCGVVYYLTELVNEADETPSLIRRLSTKRPDMYADLERFVVSSDCKALRQFWRMSEELRLEEACGAGGL